MTNGVTCPVSLPVPQAAVELGGDAPSCQRPLRSQTHALGGTPGLRQGGDLWPPADPGAPGEDHQTGQAHLPA